MQGEMPHPFFLHDPVALDDLVLRYPVLRFDRVADDGIAGALRSRVVAERNHLGQRGKKIDVGDVVKIDDRSQLESLRELVHRRVVAGQHDATPLHPARRRDVELRKAGTIAAKAFLFGQQLDDGRVWQRLDREVVTEAGSPGKPPAEGLGVLQNRLLVVQIERGRKPSGKLQQLPLLHWQMLCTHMRIFLSIDPTASTTSSRWP